jgi:hypothetical protein
VVRVLELKLGDGRKRSRRLRKKWKVEIRKEKGESGERLRPLAKRIEDRGQRAEDSAN